MPGLPGFLTAPLSDPAEPRDRAADRLALRAQWDGLVLPWDLELFSAPSQNQNRLSVGFIWESGCEWTGLNEEQVTGEALAVRLHTSKVLPVLRLS